MRWTCMAVFLFVAFGCSSKPNQLPDVVPCKFALLANDGTPLADQILVADSDGQVAVFVELEAASISLDHLDLAGRQIEEPKHWELDLCVVDRSSENEKLRPVASLIFDDPAIGAMYPAAVKELIPQFQRPESFSSDNPAVTRYFGSVNVRGIRNITGPREFVLRLFPSPDKIRAIPVTRMMGMPVFLQYFHAEFQLEGKD